MTELHHFADLEIRIFKREAQGYPVELTLNREQEFARGFLAADILSWVSTADDAEDGQALFRRLFAHEQLKTAWAEVRGAHPQRRIRLRIDDEAPELHVIPWELLRDEEGHEIAATANTPFSRYLAKRQQLGGPIFQRPVRILVAVATPKNLSDYNLAAIDVEEEWASLQAAVNGLDVELCRLPDPCTLATLEAECKGGYHILHLICHGRFNPKEQMAALFLCDDDDKVALTTERAFAAMLARQLAGAAPNIHERLRLVFLASCQSATRSAGDSLHGLAPRLVEAGVPAVIAMQDLVTVAAARTFVATFYQRLLTHGQVDLASNEARAALLTQSLSGAHVPVLFLRQREGRLLDQQGELANGGGETFWPFLLDKIYDDKCIPFLGPGINNGLLPTPESLAQTLAAQYTYPLADKHDLARVAQFMAINGGTGDLIRNYTAALGKGLFTALGEKAPALGGRRERGRGSQPKPLTLAQQITELKWAERILDLEEDQIHHLLADIQFPLYITTNMDNLLEEVLHYRQQLAVAAGERDAVSVRTMEPRWNAVAGAPKYLMEPEVTLEHPVIFHLNGFESDGFESDTDQQLILTEDDYLRHFARVSYEQEIILPTDLLERLSESTVMLIGFRLEDWQFRVVLHGLLNHIARTGSDKRRHVGVQLEPSQVTNRDAAQTYLRDYLQEFNINIYWGRPKQFIGELHSRWQTYLKDKE